MMLNIFVDTKDTIVDCSASTQNLGSYTSSIGLEEVPNPNPECT